MNRRSSLEKLHIREMKWFLRSYIRYIRDILEGFYSGIKHLVSA